MLLNFVCIGADGLEVEKDISLGQHWPVLRVEHVKIVYLLIGQVSTEITSSEDKSTHRTGRDG